jgi:transposase
MNVVLHDAADANRLMELIRREHSARQRDRYRCVLLAAMGEEDGELEGDQIAGRLGRSPRFVDKWLARYRTGGIAALHTAKPPGRKSRLTAEQCAQLTAELDAGPPPESGRSALVARDIKALIESRFEKLYSLNGVYALLHRLGYSWLMPRPRHPQADPAAQEDFKKGSPSGSTPSPRIIPASVS